METNKTNEKKFNSVAVILAAIGLVALIVIMTVLFLVFREKPVEGSKSISIEVISKEDYSRNFSSKFFRALLFLTENLRLSLNLLNKRRNMFNKFNLLFKDHHFRNLSTKLILITLLVS